ncbi:MAG: ACP S-malonyltransferase [Bacteroidales bacterium]|nr:ACP S-malonyltransferase [Bacteroidales bacterium]MBP5782297.1 ACP S-malonyltransferase [Bacteroidales bacterium]MBR5650776.1 ACP S-malonyltransferase [Bacteroidales bacterium]MBR5720143.1 ACP S-malonyltransferase [Bacteroidales bacterium]
MKAYIFPGQGAQYSGMGKDLYESSSVAKRLFKTANDVLDFDIAKIMFEGTEEELVQTKVTQPAIYIHSVILAKVKKDLFKPDMVAGHSLGEFSALAAIDGLSFEDGLKLVSKRAMLMQKACEAEPSTMAAVLKMEASVLERILMTITDDTVVAANYNTPEQIVISGTVSGVEKATELIKKANGRVLPLKVGGAFHSPLMQPAHDELSEAIMATDVNMPNCPIYQNVNGQPVRNPDIIKSNLVKQLTSPVRWTQTIQNMLAAGANSFTEVGPGTALQGMVRRIKSDVETNSL